MKTIQHRQPSTDQAGFAAILVTMVIMIVIGLIVLGFAQIARREQRQSLDRQLSTQAFYAAETGVNDAITALGKPTVVRLDPADKTSCTKFMSDNGPVALGGAGLIDPTLNSRAGVSYTCLLVDPSPSTLVYSPVGDQSRVTEVTTGSGGATINQITFTWQAKSGATASAANCPPTGVATDLPPNTAAWSCVFGLARVDLVPVSPSVTRDGLQQNTMTGFFVPVNGGGSNPPYVANGSGPANSLYKADCSLDPPNTDQCTATINVSALAGNDFYMRFRFPYANTAKLTICAFGTSLGTGSCTTGNRLALSNSQTLIDATGKANDVLRRIQVRAGSNSNATADALVPDFAIQTKNSLCKRFSYTPGQYPSTTSTDPSCQYP